MTPVEARELVYNQLSSIRKIEHIVLSDLFDRACENASPNAMTQMGYYIKTHNVEALRRWVKDNCDFDLQEMPFQRLRLIAQRRRIPYWHRMDKLNLIEAIYHDQIRADKNAPYRNETGN